ncbi:AAA family ATPase [Bacillus paranthracis]|uniref:AAA family ATPase n=1 Tax=Bacillus paranthracis TaxID=2026186 RepID=UPI00254C9701|nr:AAA family ATPase [Bacillus paranthracis]MDK7491911.1 AAA family ATPase [Bacillus paranthracis]
MPDYNQANPDGTIEIATEPLLTNDRVREIVKDAIDGSTWSASWSFDQRTQLKGTITNPEGETLSLNIHCKPLNNTGRNSPNDKRIQLKDIEIVDDGNTINLLLGVYERSGNAVIVGWNIDAYSETGKNHSAKISVEKIADAMRDGLSTFKISAKKKRNAYAFKPDFLISYISNLDNFYANDFNEGTDEDSQRESELRFEPNEIPTDFSRNLIVYGAPGTGKSRELDQDAEDYFPNSYLKKRVTFYPKYSYSQFIGVYQPSPLYRESPTLKVFDASMVREATYQYEPLIDYKFELGPLLEMYCRAKKNPRHNFLLIIEEINRTNAASVFGDFFQLLDRNSNGESTYSITLRTNILNAIKASLGEDIEDEIKIPSNLYIWATMNSGDQGVQPMDAAFKRRWTFKYLPLNKYESDVAGKKIYLKFLNDSVSWNGFRKVINDFLASEEMQVPEDKLIGPFFIKNGEFENEEIFINKILLYLRDDVLRHNPTRLFRKSTFSKIVEDYKSGDRNRPIFIEEIQDALEGLAR